MNEQLFKTRFDEDKNDLEYFKKLQIAENKLKDRFNFDEAMIFYKYVCETLRKKF